MIGSFDGVFEDEEIGEEGVVAEGVHSGAVDDFILGLEVEEVGCHEGLFDFEVFVGGVEF
jgi:hypothetical protein